MYIRRWLKQWKDEQDEYWKSGFSLEDTVRQAD